jgi:hypothetical protein
MSIKLFIKLFACLWGKYKHICVSLFHLLTYLFSIHATISTLYNLYRPYVHLYVLIGYRRFCYLLNSQNQVLVNSFQLISGPHYFCDKSDKVCTSAHGRASFLVACSDTCRLLSRVPSGTLFVHLQFVACWPEIIKYSILVSSSTLI